MSRGGSSTSQFFTGAIVLQVPQALDTFVLTAQPGNEFVYCEAPEPQYGETWSRAGELAQDGLVLTFSRRRAGGGWQYYLVRTAKQLPRRVSPQDKVLSDRATAAIYAQLKREASLGLPCSSDEALKRAVGLNSRNQAAWRIRELIRVELIASTVQYEGGVQTRVVTIAAGPHAGSAAGKFTALPKKWAELQRAAERELRQAGGAK